MVPAIAFAYEHAELDIMERYPRNSKCDYLVGRKMISFSYLQIGMIQQFGALFCYFFIMNDYGMRPGTLFGLDSEFGYYPKSTDVYDPSLPNNGNTNFGIESEKSTLNWLNAQYGKIDVRLFYTGRNANAWSACRWSTDDTPEFYRISQYTGSQICYTTEALKHSHTAYLVAIVCLQWTDCIISKTRMLSISQQGMGNHHGNFGLFFESALILFVAYTPFMNTIFQTRGLAFPHLGVPAWPWVAMMFFYDEMRRIYVRFGMERQKDGHIKLTGWVARNTYY